MIVIAKENVYTAGVWFDKGEPTDVEEKISKKEEFQKMLYLFDVIEPKASAKSEPKVEPKKGK